MRFIEFLLLLLWATSSQPQHKHGQIAPKVSIPDSAWGNIMEMDARNMHRYCEGICAFIPAGCQEDLSCKIVLSVSKFTPPCEFPEARHMCTKRSKDLYMIAILRMIPPPVVNSMTLEGGTLISKIGGKETRCEINPFVALSLAVNTDQEFSPYSADKHEDLIYLCILNFPHITTWIRTEESFNTTLSSSCFANLRPIPEELQTDEYVQLTKTKPYPSQGVGVMWSKVSSQLDQFSMACKFVISSRLADLEFQLPGNDSVVTAQLFDFEDLNAKIATGFAYIKDGVIERVGIRSTPKPVYLSYHTEDDAAIYFQSRYVKTWYHQHLVRSGDDHEEHQTIIPEGVNPAAVESYEHVNKLCVQKKAMCFFLHEEETCPHTKNCHFLAAVEALDGFEKLRVYIMFQPLFINGQNQHVHPQGYGAIGFSNDTYMGGDLVVLCTAKGEVAEASLTVNVVQNNEPIFDDDYKDGFVPDFRQTKILINMDTETVMCVAEISTGDIIVRSFTNANPEAGDKKDTWLHYHFYFQTHQFYVLLAQGTRVGESSKIAYHNYRKVSEQAFSKKIYLEYTSGAVLNTCNGHQKLAVLVITLFRVSITAWKTPGG